MSVETLWLDEQAELTLSRLLPRIEATLGKIRDSDVFLARLKSHFSDAFQMFYSLYNGNYDFFYQLEQTIIAAAEMFDARSDELKALDAQRVADPEWFQ